MLLNYYDVYLPEKIIVIDGILPRSHVYNFTKYMYSENTGMNEYWYYV